MVNVNIAIYMSEQDYDTYRKNKEEYNERTRDYLKKIMKEDEGINIPTKWTEDTPHETTIHKKR